MGAGASFSAESKGELYDSLSQKWDELIATDEYSSANFTKPECYEDMLTTAIPETQGIEREFYLALRSEFMKLTKEVHNVPS